MEESIYFNYFFKSILSSYIGILLLSLLIGFLLYKNKKILLESKAKELYKIASTTDGLIQCRNRKAYIEDITEQLSLTNRYSIPFTLMLYDIDYFKSVNDNYGHNRGDKVLIEIANLIKSIVRENDHLYRIGGDEFMILFSHTTVENGVKVAQEVRKTIEKAHLLEKETVTISVGVTQVQKNDTEDSLFQRVDKYLYTSKKEGRNCITSDLDTKV